MLLKLYKKNNAGMAILITLTVCVFLLVFATTLYQQNREVRIVEFKVKESLRAQFLAKGAAQMALLKIRTLPTEFYDAVRWSKGWVDETKVPLPLDIKKFIPNVVVNIPGFVSNPSAATDGTPHYLDFYVGFHVDNPTPLGNVQLLGKIIASGSDLYYAADMNDPTNDPFKGDCVVKQIRLISQHNNNISDNVEIVAEGSEDSGNTYMMNNSLGHLKDTPFSQYNSVYRTMIDIGYMVVK
ncbi:MAG TPA: hypothetical protein PK467_07395 [Candidatus Wallbacteria bacterium]|nr:hypothetical protein [Candidatus Wallbacteria bacterium]